MTTTKLDALFAQTQPSHPSGIYRFASRASAETVQRRAEQAGWRCFHLDGREIKDKASFLQACNAAMEFPDYAGRNWDAFEELVTDLSWAPADGYVVLYDHASVYELSQPRSWATAMDILGDAAKSWADSGTPFYVLVRGSEAVLPTL
jgi:RNAse (barnase) inhibitor barstar